MKARCLNPTDAAYSNYGGRGITICAEWRNDFIAFLDHVGLRPSPKHSLDRINNYGNYEPGNVRWATAKEQANNRRRWTHCKRGHRLAAENVYLKPSGKRECRICTNNALRARRAKAADPRRRLLAAAPDLLAACRLALRQMEALAPTLSTANYLRAAIAKAER